MLEIPGKSSLSGTNVARIVFVVFIVAVVALYMNALPKPPPADFSITGFAGFDLETGDPTVKEIRINSVSGFSGTVTVSLGTMTWASDYTGPTEIDVEVSSNTVTVPSGSYGTVTISWTASPSTWDAWMEAEGESPSFDVELTATDGGNTHTASASVRVVDFVD